MNPKLKEALENFVDALETEYGEVEGIELRLDHPIEDGERQGFANIKEFILIHLSRTSINIE
jgi:hypothetical protein